MTIKVGKPVQIVQSNERLSREGKFNEVSCELRTALHPLEASNLDFEKELGQKSQLKGK